MNMDSLPVESLINNLSERARELECLYSVEKLTRRTAGNLDAFMHGLLEAIPSGWQYAESCGVNITFRGEIWSSSVSGDLGLPVQKADIYINDGLEGSITVSYPASVHHGHDRAFLPEEQSLLEAIASLTGKYLAQIPSGGITSGASAGQAEWETELRLLKKIDKRLHESITRKMLNLLCRKGVEEARAVLSCIGMKQECPVDILHTDQNKPIERISQELMETLDGRVYRIAKKHLDPAEVTEYMRRWILDDKAAPLASILENRHTSLGEIMRVLSQLHEIGFSLDEITPAVRQNIQSLMISRLLSEQTDFIRTARPFIDTNTFYDILMKTITPTNSFGKLGGKSSGLIIASKILESCRRDGTSVRTPKTWFITSDGLLAFIHFNHLEEIYEQKYKAVGQIVEEYANNVQVFKNSRFPVEVVKGLSLALEDIGDVPIIVRSSSLLEDRLGMAFSGKYKSLFLANQGTRHERLISLMDAIAEVYASTFGPDPIEYRRERNLIDFHEEMGIMIQEVIGKRIGKYFMPAFSGVAFSRNEFRWSPRIEREDGLIRMVPGLGTRAVDRLSEDYPKLLSPGKPDLAVNITPDEIAQYSPNKLDVIDLEEGTFTSISVSEILKTAGDEYPEIENIVSTYRDGRIIHQPLFQLDFARDDLVVTFDGIIRRTNFTASIKTILDELEEKMGTPVDIEFAHDGKHLYLLQCRPQSYSSYSMPSPIPHDIPEQEVLFSANRYVSNGIIPDISYIVYISPEGYSALTDRNDLETIGRIVSELNALLPKKKFVLLGPGRWGSRGDIRLGIKVGYSDINNTAMLIEIARRRGDYVPDLSFGTHFFQDLVESSIRYLPLYPDETNNHWNELFISRADNMLVEILPEYRKYTSVVYVVDVPKEKKGRILRILQNADLNEAIAYFTKPNVQGDSSAFGDVPLPDPLGQWWKWRLESAEKIAEKIALENFGIKAMYVIGSTKNANAGPESDIDLLIHLGDDAAQRNELDAYLRGWDQSLCEMNYYRTGYRLERILDIHYITDADIRSRTSFAVKIDAVTDPAKRIL